MYKNLITVIIPTRNRQIYAAAAARQILSLKQDIQVVLQDNSDDDTLTAMIENLLTNDHFVYHHIHERVAFVDNYEIAASYAEGEYLIALGDDDGLLGNISECTRWMKDKGIDALKPSVKTTYFWPDKNSNVQSKREGIFGSQPYTGKIKYYNTCEYIKTLLKKGGQDYLSLPLAGTYHRIVRMELMNQVKQITGRYYGGLTPDMYSAVCLSLLPNIKFAEIDYPISLPGICPSSASAKSARGEHCGKLETAPHLVGLKEPYIWDNRVPRYYSVETIWAETLLKAVEAMGMGNLIKKYYNDEYLIYSLYKNNQNVKIDIEELIGKDRIDSLRIEIPRSENSVERFFNKSVNYIVRRIPGNCVVYTKCNSIIEATEEMTKMIQSKRMRMKWSKLVNESGNDTGDSNLHELILDDKI